MNSALQSGSLLHGSPATGHGPLTPVFATLTSRPQITENPTTLSPFLATHTDCPFPNSFICHSYENNRGVYQLFPKWNAPSPASAPNTPPSTRKTSTKPTLLPPSSETPRNSVLLSLSTAPSANSINSRPGTKSTPAAPPSWPTPATSSSAPSPPSSTNSIPNSKIGR